MQIEAGLITGNVPKELQAYTEQRLRAALALFTGQFDSVKVSLSTVTRDGGPRTACQIKVRLNPSGVWVIQESHDSHPYGAIDRATEGIGKTFSRQLKKTVNSGGAVTAAA